MAQAEEPLLSDTKFWCKKRPLTYIRTFRFSTILFRQVNGISGSACHTQMKKSVMHLEARGARSCGTCGPSTGANRNDGIKLIPGHTVGKSRKKAGD